MRNLQHTFLSLFLVMMAFVLFNCAQPPKEEEKAAKDAIQAARDVEAPTYAQHEWFDADQTYTAAEAKMQNKEYDDAKKLFLEAQEKARASKEASENNKQALVAELTKSKESVQAAISTVKAEFGKQRKKVAKEAAANIEAVIKESEQGIEDASQLILNGKLNDAKEKLAAASVKEEGATSALQTAITAKQKKHTAVKHTKSTAVKHTKAVVAKHAPKKKKGI